MGVRKAVVRISMLCLVAASCTEPESTVVPQTAEAIVSNVLDVPAGPTGLSLRRASELSPGMAALALEDEFVYIALAPGSVPDGMSASIANPRVEGVISVTLIDGGFDPVPIAAVPGDNIIVSVRKTDGALHSFRAEVPIRRRPSVVRTSVPRSKKGVPLNMHIRVVFSEPVSPSTVSPTTVQVFRGNTPVVGSVHVEAAGLVAAFVANTAFDANAPYRLVVTTGVQDLEGEALDRALELLFETGTTIVGPVNSIRMLPDTVELSTLTYQMRAQVRDAEGNELGDNGLVWSTTDEGVHVTQSGLVTALAEGQYDVYAQLGDVRGSGRIHVRSYTGVHDVSVTPAPTAVALEDTVLLEARLRDEDGVVLDSAVTWSSSDPSIATVEGGGTRNRTGAVITHRTGSVTITATSGSVSGTAVVNVLPPRPAVSITLGPDPLTMLANVPTKIERTLRDVNGRPVFARPTQWTSEDPAIATVDAEGVVTGLRAGSTTIVAVAEGLTARLPVTITTLDFRSVAAGGSRSCALTEEKLAYCWGSVVDNFAPLISSTVPTAVPGGLTFESLVVGGLSTCGLRSDGAAYCWGSNVYGNLGNNSFEPSVSPVAVQGGHRFVALSAGTDHVCGLTGEGAALCWGANFDRQLGVEVGPTTAVRPIPVAVSGGHTFTSIVAALRYTCALKANGEALCWGANSRGQLGDGTTTTTAVPTPVAGGIAFAQLASPSSGAEHMCGVASDGRSWCWGNNALGQLGDGTATGGGHFSTLPVLVAGDHQFAALTGGFFFTCGLSTTSAGFCWGSNLDARLGIGSASSGVPNPFDFRPAPVAVAGGIAFATLSAGGGHACGMSLDSIVYCWGRGQEGQLGRGSTTQSSVPTKVGGQP